MLSSLLLFVGLGMQALASPALLEYTDPTLDKKAEDEEIEAESVLLKTTTLTVTVPPVGGPQGVSMGASAAPCNRLQCHRRLCVDVVLRLVKFF